MDELDNSIKNSFDGTIEYLKKNNIQVEEKLSLIILESYEEYQQKYGINPRIHVGEYDRMRKEIHIIKNRLKEVIDRDINDQNKIFIGNIVSIYHNGILWPVYKNDNDIEKLIVKAVTDSIVTHEIGHAILHFIGGNSEWNASFFEFLIYFYKNELYKYPEVYEILEENVEICEKYIKKENPSSPYSLGSRLAPYSFGSCFANDIIYVYENVLNKDKQSPKLNIKDMIEKLKFFSKDYYVEITKKYNEALIDYIDTAKTLNAKYSMLSWMTNCLLEKPPNITNNM
jgi:hypothetical protein